MNRKNVKSKLSYKSFIFWGLIALLTIGFVVATIVIFVNNTTVKSYERVDHIRGQEVYTQAEDTYLVFVYDSTVTNEDLDENMFNYISFVKANKKNTAVFKVYCFDLNDTENKKCLSDIDVIENTTTYPSTGLTGGSGSDVLQINRESTPLLMLVTSNKVSKCYDTDNEIKDYLQSIIDANK